jgi:hypothetical protein
MNNPCARADEGRVLAARPSSCLIASLLAAVALLCSVPAAQAAPPIPILTGTDPASPSTDLAPFVHGNSTGVIISSFPGVRASALPVGRGAEGANVALYLNKSCEGVPSAEGTANALDTVGIQIEVEAETTTYVTAKQSDGTGASGCSNAIEYQHVKELPPPSEDPPAGPGAPPGAEGSGPPPPRLRTIPAGIANDNVPLVAGSAPGAALVKIFTNPSCDGNPVAGGSVAQLAGGIPVRVADNVVVAFYGVSVGPGGARSRCSAPTYYVEDSIAPHTRITMGPAAKTRRRTAIFRFTDVNGEMPGTDFFCKVDRRKWRHCRSPLRLGGLRLRGYTVRVKAIDPAGNVERQPAKRRFKVVPAA